MIQRKFSGRLCAWSCVLVASISFQSGIYAEDVIAQDALDSDTADIAGGSGDGAVNGDPNAPVTREEFNRLADQFRLRYPGSGEVTDSGLGEASRLPGGKGGLYDKPFLGAGSGPSAYLGGYFDVEYRDPESARHEFRFHRLIPFIYADIHERIRFATEIEIEDGKDVQVEFAYLDLLLVDEVNIRGGVILNPLGKFNLIHDSPINDLTDRPLLSRYVIPTTLREVGLGSFGTLTPPESQVEVKYEGYLTSGFKGLDNDGHVAITSTSGLRNARPHKSLGDSGAFDDVNNKFAGVGRLSVSPLLGTEMGASFHSGTYDEAGDNALNIVAIDGLVTIPEFTVADRYPVGPIELQAEAAHAFVERDNFAKAQGVADDLSGYYAQVNYHFMPAYLTESVPLLFPDDSTFTAVYRWGHVNLDGYVQRRSTIGLNYRPVESAAFKIDYQFNRGTGSAPNSADDDAFVASLTSYF